MTKVHLLGNTNGKFVCGQINNGEVLAPYYFIEDLMEHGREYIEKLNALNYKENEFCEKCWDMENLGIHLLGMI